MFDFLNNRKAKKPLGSVPEFMQDQDPVNYNSVLEYLTGLSKTDYAKIIKSADIYRDANAKVAKVVGVKDEPTHQLLPVQPTDDEIDTGLDNLLEADDLETAFLEDEPTKPKKPQAPGKLKKIDVAD